MLMSQHTLKFDQHKTLDQIDKINSINYDKSKNDTQNEDNIDINNSFENLSNVSMVKDI